MLGSSWVTAQLTASQEGLSSLSEWWYFVLFAYLQRSIVDCSVIFTRVGKTIVAYWIYRLGKYVCHFFFSLLSLLLKNKSRFVRSPCCLCVPVSTCVCPLTTFECLNHSLWNLVCISWHLSPSEWRTYKTLINNANITVSQISGAKP
jgi:hypothetical protein